GGPGWPALGHRPRCARSGVPAAEHRAAGRLRPAPPRRPAAHRDRRYPRHPGRHRQIATPLCDPGPAGGRRGRRDRGRPRRADGMTNERDFDRLARAWLELGPDETPDRVVAAVLQATETTPQVRPGFRWPMRRSFTMTRFPILVAIAATLIAVIGA